MRTFVGLVCKFFPSIVIALLLLSIPKPSFADATSATLSISITDPSGAMVSGADVSLQNTDTNQLQAAQSGRSGATTFSFLKPGHYSVIVSKEHFSDISVGNIILNVGDNRTLALVLKVGSIASVVTVDGSGPSINTTDGSVSTVIDRQFVENIPLNGRSFQDLILLTPGVVTNSPQTQGVSGAVGDFSVNGQRTESNNYLVDGVSANTGSGAGGYPGANSGGNVASSTALGTTQSLVSVDALQEFRVNSSTYSAEYGRTPGGQFSFVTRSGTNEFHGSVYEYLRNNYFDANNWFSDYYKTAEPALRQNDFGGTIGGPVRIPRFYNGQDKTFFFVSYEGLRLTQPQVATLHYVPSLALRQNPSLSPILQPILNAFPLPTLGRVDHGNGLADFIQADSLPSQIDSTSVRIDQALSSNVRLFFRFSDAPSSSAIRTLSVYQPQASSSKSYTLGATAQLRSNISDEFRLGYSETGGNSKYILDSFGGAQPTNIAAALGAGTAALAGGDFIFSAAGTGVSTLQTHPNSSGLKQWNVTDTLAWSRGKHQLKMGFDFRNITSPYGVSSPYPEYVYTNESQIIANKALEGIGTVSISATPIYREFSAFGQDEWHPISRLTLSLGMRWEVNPAPSAKNGDLPYTVLGNFNDPSTWTLAPRGTQLWKTTWYNLAPRVGAAWIAHEAVGYETVLRAGGGVFFDTGNETAPQGYTGVGYYAEKQVLGASAPFPGLLNLTPSLTAPYSSAPVNFYYPHLQLPYTLEWSGAIEQGLGHTQTFTISYVGSNGRRLLEQNQFSIAAQNSAFAEVTTSSNGTTSSYNSLQVKFQRTVAHGLQALAAYTWSHSLDYESADYTLALIRGNSDFDVRNNFTAGVTWQTPSGHGDRVVRALLNNWALDDHFLAHTAFPVTLQGNQLTNPANGNVFYGGLDLKPNVPIYLHVDGLPGNREINAAAFEPPTGNQNGNAPRNLVRGFGAVQMNMAARREFHLTESMNLQFRAETFNIFNHPNFGLIDPMLTDATFGQATQTLNQSLTTVSPLYQMGGPRSMQFALKLQF